MSVLLLILGLLVFLGIHAVRAFAPDWRAAQIQRLGEPGWKGVFSIVALCGLALIVWGFGRARLDPVVLWHPPTALRHVAAMLMLPAFVLLVAAYMPGSRLKARVRHPMLLGVVLWALAHLMANGRLAAMLLFGSFLVWAALAFRAALRRDAAAGNPPLPLYSGRDVFTSLLGIFAWISFALWLHAPLIGVSPFGSVG